MFSLILALVACGDPEPTACTDIAVAAVNVTVVDAAGNPVEGAAVEVVAGGQTQSCTLSGDTFACAYEQHGTMVVHVIAGATDAEQTVEVPLDAEGCHPVPQSVTFEVDADTGGCLLPCGGDSGS